jgi:DNA polymerase III delta subunit
MKVLLLTGDDEEKVQKRLFDIIKNSQEKGFAIERLETSEDLGKLSQGLFFSKKTVIVDGKIIASKRLEEWFRQNLSNPDLAVVIASKKEVELSRLGINNAKVERYNLPKILWNFLDSLKRGNSKISIGLLKKLLIKEPPELILYFMGQRFVQMYLVSKYPKVVRLNEWQKTKLVVQSSGLSLDEIRSLIGEICEIDYLSKVGKADLPTYLDLFIIKNLQ